MIFAFFLQKHTVAVHPIGIQYTIQAFVFQQWETHHYLRNGIMNAYPVVFISEKQQCVIILSVMILRVLKYPCYGVGVLLNILICIIVICELRVAQIPQIIRNYSFLYQYIPYSYSIMLISQTLSIHRTTYT